MCFSAMIVSNCTIKHIAETEGRYNTIGDISAGNLTNIGNLQDADRVDDILFVVYTERIVADEDGKSEEVTHLVSARLATSFEREPIMADEVNLTRELIDELTFTTKELKELELTRIMSITLDEDCPETTPGGR